MPAQRVLVTGDEGYIGSVLTRVLSESGHDVVGLDSALFRGCDFGSPPDPTTTRRDLREVRADDLAGIDAVVHLAALSNDPLGDLDPALTHDINTLGTLRLAQAARDAGVSRFIFASSCSTYGATGSDDLLDENAPLRPVTPYAESKVRTEERLRELVDDDFAVVSMRNATAFGVSPRLRLDIVLNNLTAWAHISGAIRMQSDGSSWRPLVHVEDIALAATTLLVAPVEAIRGQAFNIGSNSENHLVRDIAALVHEQYPSCQVIFAEGAGSDPRSYRVSFDRFARTFPGHRFRWTAREGVRQLAEAYRAIGLDATDLGGSRFIRLNRLKALMGDGSLDESLRWQRSPREAGRR